MYIRSKTIRALLCAPIILCLGGWTAPADWDQCGAISWDNVTICIHVTEPPPFYTGEFNITFSPDTTVTSNHRLENMLNAMLLAPDRSRVELALLGSASLLADISPIRRGLAFGH